MRHCWWSLRICLLLDAYLSPKNHFITTKKWIKPREQMTDLFWKNHHPQELKLSLVMIHIVIS